VENASDTQTKRRSQPAHATAPARCRDCFYVLEGLDSTRCPECGRPFDLNDSSSYTRRPPFIGWVFWLPGLLLALGGGLVSAIFLYGFNHLGVALWIGVPFAAGAVLGYRVRTRAFFLFALIFTLAVAIPLGLIALDLSGFFCGVMLAGVFLAPVAVGTAAGTILRLVLKASSFSHRSYLPVAALLAIPFLWAVFEGATPAFPERTVATTHVIDAPPATVWDNIVFYEEVERTPPLLLRIGLPRPIGTSGPIDRVGAIRTCLYDKGSIVKRVTSRNPNDELAFAVTHQDIHFEHDVRLVGGRFKMQRIHGDRTRVTLETTYEPLLPPRWCWRPIEELAIHTLHEHVLAGMAIRCEQNIKQASWAPTEAHNADHD